MPDINISNLQVPPTTTMPAHVASANPHPQYALVGDIANIAKASISVSDLADVNVVEPQLANTILIYDGNNYTPIDMTTLGTLIQIPMATSNNAGIIRVASTIFELDSCAATPKLVVDYVNNTIAASAYGYATTAANGVVRLATANDIASSDQSAVVTASVLNDVVSSNLYTLPSATNSTLGGVKTIETDSPAGREFIAELITSNSVGGGVPDFNTYVPAIQYNQFVNVRVGVYDDNARALTSEVYYSTHAETVSTDASAHDLANTTNKTVAYLVYSNGVISGVSDGYNGTLSTYVDILEQGTAYDINTSGAVVTVHQEGNIKRVVVPNYQLNVYGTAHDVVISSGGNVIVDSHGHLEYAKVESGGILHCFDGVAENITIYSGGLVHIDGGKGYNITLLSGATAYIYTYAKDVIVHGGAHLGTPDFYDYTGVTPPEGIYTKPKIDNLILYTGANFFPTTSNATINGCILHPGATVNYVEGATINYNTCRETEHPVWVIKSRVVNYYKDTETSKEFGVTEYTYEQPDGTVTSSVILPQLKAFFEPKGTSIVHNYTDSTSSVTITTIDRVYVWAIDTPCGFRRIDTSAVSAMNSMLSEGITADNADEYNRQAHLASTYISAQIISHVKAGAQITNFYALEVPTSTVILHTVTSDYEAHMVNELTSETSRYKYKVVF